MKVHGSIHVVTLLLLGLFTSAAGAATLPRTIVWEETLPAGDENPLKWPVDVAAASSTEIAVVDARQSLIFVIEMKGGRWQVVGQAKLPGAPVAVAHDGSRWVVAMREGEGLVAVEGDRYQLRRLTLPTGTVPGSLAGGSSGGVLLYDYNSGRVLVLDDDGSVLERVDVEGHVTDLEAAAGGGFYAVFGDRSELRRYGANGAELGRWELPGRPPVPAWPSGLAVGPEGIITVVDRHNSRLLTLSTGGQIEGTGSRKGWEPGLLYHPAGIAQLPDGRVVVADLGNGRLQLFSPIDPDEGP